MFRVKGTTWRGAFDATIWRGAFDAGRRLPGRCRRLCSRPCRRQCLRMRRCASPPLRGLPAFLIDRFPTHPAGEQSIRVHFSRATATRRTPGKVHRDRNDESHGLTISLPRVDVCEWLVRPVFMARSLVSPRNFCCFPASFFGGNKPQRTQAII